MITLQLYKTMPNKLTEYLDVYFAETIPLKESTVTISGKTYVFKHIVTDNYNIAIVEESKQGGAFWNNDNLIQV
jgi:hypothetical protein